MYQNLPVGLRHVLELYRLVRESRLTRIMAVREVARRERIDQATVSSACTRSIGINTGELDDYLLSRNAESFCSHLVQRFPTFQKEIEGFFNNLNGQEGEFTEDPTSFVRTLFPEEKRNLLQALLLKQVSKNLTELLSRSDLPDELRSQMNELKEQIGKI